MTLLSGWIPLAEKCPIWSFCAFQTPPVGTQPTYTCYLPHKGFDDHRYLIKLNWTKGPPQHNHKASYKYLVSAGFVPSSLAASLTLPSSGFLFLFVLSKHLLLKIIIAPHLPNNIAASFSLQGTGLLAYTRNFFTGTCSYVVLQGEFLKSEI